MGDTYFSRMLLDLKYIKINLTRTIKIISCTASIHVGKTSTSNLVTQICYDFIDILPPSDFSTAPFPPHYPPSQLNYFVNEYNAYASTADTVKANVTTAILPTTIKAICSVIELS